MLRTRSCGDLLADRRLGDVSRSAAWVRLPTSPTLAK